MTILFAISENRGRQSFALKQADDAWSDAIKDISVNVGILDAIIEKTDVLEEVFKRFTVGKKHLREMLKTLARADREVGDWVADTEDHAAPMAPAEMLELVDLLTENVREKVLELVQLVGLPIVYAPEVAEMPLRGFDHSMDAAPLSNRQQADQVAMQKVLETRPINITNVASERAIPVSTHDAQIDALVRKLCAGGGFDAGVDVYTLDGHGGPTFLRTVKPEIAA